MMSNTGGGHKASAEALQQAFEEKYGDKYKVGKCG
jgi:1,2-diacylglycerol 3-beta-galactosyltransferase